MCKSILRGNMGQGQGGGRPIAFNSPEEMQEKIDAYFAECKEEDRPLTMSGLAYALDVDRKTIVNYEKKHKYFRTVQRARQRVELYSEEQLFRNQGTVNGVKFSLTNNFGWEDKQTKNHTGDVPKFNVTFNTPENDGDDE